MFLFATCQSFFDIIYKILYFEICPDLFEILPSIFRPGKILAVVFADCDA